MAIGTGYQKTKTPIFAKLQRNLKSSKGAPLEYNLKSKIE